MNRNGGSDCIYYYGMAVSRYKHGCEPKEAKCRKAPVYYETVSVGGSVIGSGCNSIGVGNSIAFSSDEFSHASPSRL